MGKEKDDNPLLYSTDGSHLGAAVPVDPAQTLLRIRLEKKGRGGKAVTVVYDLPPVFPGDNTLVQLAKELKRHCGTGGGLKNNTLEIQGDQRDKVQIFLEQRGFQVRRSGG